MTLRRNEYDVTNRVNVEIADQVRDAVLEIYAARYPGEDLAPLRRAFDDMKALFAGRYPGYLACDTLYHDLRHTLDMTLATARLIDGHDRTCATADWLGARRAMFGVMVALLHDSGYIRRNSESGVENGAVFTKVHVSRSAEFLRSYLPTVGFAAEANTAARLTHFTGYELDIEQIGLKDAKDHLLGCIVGTSDLIAQIADRQYIEKCRDFLYREFVWGGIAREIQPDGREIVRYASPTDLVIKTPGFYQYFARPRIEKTLKGVDRYAEAHLDGPNLYQQEIARNMEFLRETIERGEFERLRRVTHSMSHPVPDRPRDEHD
ncbi:MAG: hypothetical protein ACREVR_02235 [Burkholderiales bacterium]